VTLEHVSLLLWQIRNAHLFLCGNTIVRCLSNSKSILIRRLKPYKNQKNSNKPTKTHSISLNKRSLLSSFCIVACPNGGATVHPQTQILPFYIIFSLSSHRWCCLSLSTICATNGSGLGLPIKVTAKQD
jgi:hypothetical protein